MVAGLATRDILIGAVLLAVLVLAFLAHRGHADRNALRQELAQRLAVVDQSSRQARETAAGAERTVREMATALRAIEDQLAESQSQQIALETLYEDLARGRDEAALAEIEQSLVAANQQLVLAGNVRVALISLQSADARLAVIDRAQHAPLRRALAGDIERLQGVPMVDVAGIALRLDRAVAGIDLLPILPGVRLDEIKSDTAAAAAADPAMPASVPSSASVSAAESESVSGAVPASPVVPPGGWRDTITRLWHEFRTEFRQLASIRRIDQNALPLITPQQSWFLRENLRLRLLSARLALLGRDEVSFRADVSMAREWVARHFDARDPAAAALMTLLRELERAEIRIELPDISASMEAVRVLRATRDRRP